MLTVLTGLLSSLSYSVSDMLSQNVSRASRPLTQIVWVLSVGVLIAVPLALVVDGVPHGLEWRGAGLAAVGGVLYFGAFFCLLRGLEIGDLGLVSALASVQGAYVAVVAVILGEPMTLLLAIALTLCVVGAVLASFEGRAKSARGALWGLACGVFFAGVMLCFGYSDIAWLSQVAISRSVSLAIALPVGMLSGGVALPRRLRGRAVVSGVLELCGMTLLAITFALGPLSVAGVATTQFGTCAVILGFFLLRERPRRNQWVGIACTLIGVSVIAALV